MRFLLNYLTISLSDNVIFASEYINFVAKGRLKVEEFKYSGR